MSFFWKALLLPEQKCVHVLYFHTLLVSDWKSESCSIMVCVNKNEPKKLLDLNASIFVPEASTVHDVLLCCFAVGLLLRQRKIVQ